MKGDTQSLSLSSEGMDGRLASCEIERRFAGLTRIRRPVEVETEGLMGDLGSSEFMNDSGTSRAAIRGKEVERSGDGEIEDVGLQVVHQIEASSQDHFIAKLDDQQRRHVPTEKEVLVE